MKFTDEHIQQLLIEKIAGTIDAKDDSFLEQQLVENAELAHRYEGMKAAVLEAEARGFLLEGNAEKSWQQVASLMEPPRKKNLLAPFLVAAAVLTALAIGISFFNEQEKPVSKVAGIPQADKQPSISLALDNGQLIKLNTKLGRRLTLGAAEIIAGDASLTFSYPSASTEQWATLSVPAIFDYKVTLADGTEVWMNSETTLRFPFNFPNKTREVYLKGEAYFKVAKNAHQPFIVHANETAIKVLGTQFNVNTYDANAVTTSLVEGAVEAGGAKKQVHLKPGFEATYHFLHKGFNIAAFDKAERLSWMNGVYYFHNMHLKDLSKILSRWYNVRVEFSNPVLQNKTFSGEIVKKQSIQFFLDNLKISNQLSTNFKNGVVTFL